MPQAEPLVAQPPTPRAKRPIVTRLAEQREALQLILQAKRHTAMPQAEPQALPRPVDSQAPGYAVLNIVFS